MFAVARSLLVVVFAFTGSQAVFAQVKADVAKQPLTDPWKRSSEERRAAFDAYNAGRYKEALGLFSGWRPNTGCGTCNESMECERVLHMALCHAHLKDYAATVGVCYKATRRGGERQAAVGVLLFHLYRDAGQLDDLKRLFEVDDSRVTDRITETVRELFRLRTLGEKKEFAELVRVCQESGWVHTFTYEYVESEWRCRAAAEELARSGDDAVKSIVEAIYARKKSVSWLIYALGKHPSGKALDALEALVAKESSWNSGNVAYAISLHGEVGQNLLQVIAKQVNTGVQAAAAEILENRFKVVAPPVYPKPKAGSLPTELFK